jgi:hypothetical protein
MRALALAVALLALGLSCGKSREAGGADAGGSLASCIDEPGVLARPPSGSLPCELIPPGLRL